MSPAQTSPHTPAQLAAHTANLAAAIASGASAAGRWPSGPGPIVHGQSSHQTKRCRELNGRACQDCRDGEAARARARRGGTA